MVDRFAVGLIQPTPGSRMRLCREGRVLDRHSEERLFVIEAQPTRNRAFRGAGLDAEARNCGAAAPGHAPSAAVLIGSAPPVVAKEDR